MEVATLVVRAGAATDVGRVREHNEDAAVVGTGVFVVADGMGGHAAGEVASAITAQTLAELGEQAKTLTLTPAQLRAQVHMANERILARAEENPACAGMATTVTGVVVVEGPRWLVFNVGDSRVYRYADERLTQVTVDHSEVALLVEAGFLTAEEARVHPLRHTVTRCLGRPYVPPVDTWELPMAAGDVFVVCSDGLTEEVEDDEIAGIVARGKPAQRTAELLAARAVELGGHDNVTVVVVRADARS